MDEVCGAKYAGLVRGSAESQSAAKHELHLYSTLVVEIKSLIAAADALSAYHSHYSQLGAPLNQLSLVEEPSAVPSAAWTS